jgi:hypothetical protein
MSLEFQFRPIAVWPGKRSAPRPSPFRASWSDTLGLLERELGKLQARNIVIQADCGESDIRRDGMLRADVRLRGPGVILSFDSRHGPLSYPCDRYRDWQSNVRAIALSLEALRAVDRYGVTRRAEQYQGWSKLPPPDAPVAPAAANTGFSSESEAAVFLSNIGGGNASAILRNRDTLLHVYRRACVATHPDHHPQHAQAFRRVQAAYEFLRSRIGG